MKFSTSSRLHVAQMISELLMFHLLVCFITRCTSRNNYNNSYVNICVMYSVIHSKEEEERNVHANLGSTDLLHKPCIRGFSCANLGSARNLLGSRNQISTICGNKPTIDCARASPITHALDILHHE